MVTAKDLDPSFRHVRLLLAREAGSPHGGHEEGYDLLVPLGPDGKLDADVWREHQKLCRVRRFSPGAPDRIGRLRRKPGGQWYVDYEEGESDDEAGFRFGDERFVTGEYVSIEGNGRMHTYQVARVEKP